MGENEIFLADLKDGSGRCRDRLTGRKNQEHNDDEHRSEVFIVADNNLWQQYRSGRRGG